jgi:hypothetical protein
MNISWVIRTTRGSVPVHLRDEFATYAFNELDSQEASLDCIEVRSTTATALIALLIGMV